MVGSIAYMNDDKRSGSAIHRITKVFKEGLEIWKSLVLEADYSTRFFTIIVLGIPLMFPLILGISYLMASLIPTAAISISISWFNYLCGLSICALMWIGIMAVRVFVKWYWNI
jgi:hypothetical protein